jgi:hypothetical protein
MSRQRGEGIIEMEHDADHAFAAGYEGSRAVRTWQERMKILEDNGFILRKKVGGRFKLVAIVHPAIPVQRLRDKNKIPDNWWNAYIALKTETKEATYEQLQKKKESAKKVVPLVSSRKELMSNKSGGT